MEEPTTLQQRQYTDEINVEPVAADESQEEIKEGSEPKSGRGVDNSKWQAITANSYPDFDFLQGPSGCKRSSRKASLSSKQHPSGKNTMRITLVVS